VKIHPTPTLPKESGPTDLWRGLGYPLRAFGLIVKSPQLLRLSLLCALVTGLTLLSVVTFAWHAAQHLSSILFSGDSLWNRAASTGLSIALFIIIFGLGALTAPNLILAPLQDPLSEATETCLGQFSPPPFSLANLARGTWASVTHTVQRLGLMVVGLLLLLPLNLIPGAGNGLYVVLSSTWSMFWLAVEHLSNPMARHLRPFGQVVRVLRRRLALALGIGAALTVVL
jgi:CysZ protein